MSSKARNLLAVGVVVAGTLLASACDYSMVGGNNQRTNVNPESGAGTISAANAAGLHVLPGFPKNIAGITGTVFGQLQAPPVAANGKLYLNGADGHLHILDKQGNQLSDTVLSGSAAFSAPPTVAGGQVFAASYDRLYAVDAATGAAQWSQPIPGSTAWSFVSSPVVANGSVFVAGNDKVKQFSTSGTLVRTLTMPKNVTAPIAIEGSNMYVGLGGGGVRAYDMNSGALVWNYACESTCKAVQAVAAVGDRVVVTRSEGRVFALATAANAPVRRLWTATNFSGTAVEAIVPAAVRNGTVYVGAKDKGIKTFSLATGAPLQSIADGGPTGLMLANDVLFSTDPLAAYDASTLALKWKPSFTSSYPTFPVVSDGRIYQINSTGQLVVFGL